MYSNNYRFVYDKSHRAVFSVKRKLKFIQSLAPSILFDMFDTIMRPILTYGSDVWGLSKTGIDVVDKVFLNVARCTLIIVKATTCNTIVYGECGRYPLSVFCHIQNKDCVLGVLRSKTKNILSPGVKSMPTNVKFYIQRLDPSTQNFRILVTTNNSYFSCPAKTAGQILTWLGKFLHKLFNIRNVKRYKSCIPSQ